MYRIVVCDDEKNFRDQLIAFLKRYEEKEKQEFEILVFDSADHLLQDYPQDPDLLLLDIYMKGIDGMEAAKKIRKFDNHVCIVFITTMYQMALEGYSVRAFGFVKKPLAYEEFSYELKCALKQIASQKEKETLITIKYNDAVYRIPVSEIMYCEVVNHNIFIHTKDKEYEYRSQMNAMEEKLGQYGFFRCHASYLVNSEYIAKIEAQEIQLKDGQKIPVSQRRRKDFMNSLSLYIGDRI